MVESARNTTPQGNNSARFVTSFELSTARFSGTPSKGNHKMTTQISTFNFKSFPVRIQSFNNEPYFCLSDVCQVLGVNRRSAEAFRLNKEGCNKIATLTDGGHQELTFINEPNLYSHLAIQATIQMTPAYHKINLSSPIKDFKALKLFISRLFYYSFDT